MPFPPLPSPLQPPLTSLVGQQIHARLEGSLLTLGLVGDLEKLGRDLGALRHLGLPEVRVKVAQDLVQLVVNVLETAEPQKRTKLSIHDIEKKKQPPSIQQIKNHIQSPTQNSSPFLFDSRCVH